MSALNLWNKNTERVADALSRDINVNAVRALRLNAPRMINADKPHYVRLRAGGCASHRTSTKTWRLPRCCARRRSPSCTNRCAAARSMNGCREVLDDIRGRRSP